jgi:hypothetical protein
VVCLPRVLRPKRYLPRESKQFSNDCPTPTSTLDAEIFLSGAGLVLVSLLAAMRKGAAPRNQAPADVSGLSKAETGCHIWSISPVHLDDGRCEDVTDV